MRLYHRTSSDVAARIVSEGFIDGVGTYMTESAFRGVWLSDRPLDCNEGAWGDTVLAVTLNLPQALLDNYEWVEEGKPFREWLIPAAKINGNATIEIVDE
jgi:hypothetical protein